MGGPQNGVGDPTYIWEPPQKSIVRQLGMGRGTFGDMGELRGNLWSLGGLLGMWGDI